jgi:hypothetical protein
VERSRLENKEWNAAEKIDTQLKEKNMKQLLPVLKALVLGRTGPLLEWEIDRSKSYAYELSTKLKEEKA